LDKAGVTVIFVGNNQVMKVDLLSTRDTKAITPYGKDNLWPSK